MLLPFGNNQWNSLQLDYNSKLPEGETFHDSDSIKLKVYALKNLGSRPETPSALRTFFEPNSPYFNRRTPVTVFTLEPPPTETEASPASAAAPQSADADPVEPPSVVADTTNSVVEKLQDLQVVSRRYISSQHTANIIVLTTVRLE
ncbi:unnamed protein product [Phytophthora fragariaefolia]|uniref:Unnamed protein product n=1 Tax=Phytophthora fragariaefolia TaxID=1490495 RepID=A0A9W6YEA6_9STRA|nr:unnamed protein product [Phytophthora fragariaefolia]